MKAIHHTEEELQAYAINGLGVAEAINRHVELCDQCKAAVAEYQALFTAIKQQPPASFNFNLAELVLAKLPAPAPAAPPGNSFIYLLVLAASALTGAALYYFRSFIVGVFTNITPLLIYFTATTSVTLVAILSLDMYKNYHRKIRALDFY